MAELGKAYVQIVPSAKGISGSIQKELGGEDVGRRAGAKIGRGMAAKIGGVMAAAGIGTMVVKGISASIHEGAALEQSLGGVETLFKDNADTVIKNASQAYRTAGMSANEYMENVTSFSASLLQSLGGDTAAAAKTSDMALTDMSDNANKFGTDMDRITDAYGGFAKQNYTMLDNLKLGYGGTKSEMERLLDDASKLSGQEYDISSLDDVYNAIHVIQEEMGVTGTTAEEASQTLSGSFASMKAAGKDLLGNLALGKDIGPSLQALVETASTFLFKNLFPAIGNIIKQLPGALATFFKENGPGIAEGAVHILKSIGQGLVENLPILFEKLNEMLNKVIEKLTSWDPLAESDGGAAIMEKVANGLIKYAPKVLKAIGILFVKWQIAINMLIGKLILKALIVLVRFIATLFSKIGSAIAQKLSNLFKRIIAKVAGKINSIKTTVVNKINAIKTAIGNAAAGIIKKFTEPFTKAKEKISGIIDKIKSIFPFSLGKILTLKLPKINVSGGKAPWGIAGKGTKPSFSLDWTSWYAKGGIFDQPTIAGIGEAGPEAVVPLDKFWNKLDNIADASTGGTSIVNNITVSGAENPEQFAHRLVRQMKMEMRMA